MIFFPLIRICLWAPLLPILVEIHLSGGNLGIMIKFIALLKRKDGMSFEDFKHYYETRHSQLRSTISHPHVSRATGYTRTYLTPARHPIEQPIAGVDYDCITEITYPDREALDADMAFLDEDEVRLIFAQDEENLFDRKYSRCYTVEE
jgi:hypothetical protein